MTTSGRCVTHERSAHRRCCSGRLATRRPSPDRFFKYWLVAPAILLLLLVGLFPLIYSLVVSFQNITMLEVDTSFAGFVNYAQLFKDARLWQALLHTFDHHRRSRCRSSWCSAC